MTRDAVRQLLRRHQDALNRHNVADLMELYADDAVLESPMFDTVRGRDAIGRSFDRLFTIFPDFTVHMSDALFLADGDRAAEFSRVTGTHDVELFGLPPTGQVIEYNAARLFTLRGGVIVNEQRIYDFRGVLERLEKTRLDRELTMASVVQHALCRTRHHGQLFDTVGATLSCRAIGGDFLEYVDLPGGKLGLALGDVSGKGPAAALVAAMLQGMFSIIAGDDPGPSAVLARLNRALCGRGIEPSFATLTYGTLAPDGRFTYANAGHHPPLVLTAAGVERLTEGGPMLGVFSDVQFPEASVMLGPGDTVVAFSDGVVEAEAPDGADFGLERLLEVVSAHREAPPQLLLDRVLAAVRDFCGNASPGDDITAAVARYRGDLDKKPELQSNGPV
jgi:steroid delta-isomerase-like uncharacterized protein